MKNLPPLTKVMDKGPESGFKFERLMKKLLIHDGSSKGYVFEPGTTYRDEGIDGIVRKNCPGMECPVIFQFKWLEGSMDSGSSAQQINQSFERMLDAGVEFQSYVLVTPHDLTGTEKKWLQNLKISHNLNIDIYHYGNTEIQVLLDGYPALKKYYYGEHVEGLSQNFNVIKEKYRQAVIEEVKHLHFIGVPIGSYQKQQLLVKPELAKVYISLGLINEEKDSETLTLSKITKVSNRVVVLGDPGSGKSTLAKYMALINSQKLGSNGGAEIDGKIPFIIPIREFVRQQQEKKTQTFNFVDYLKYIAEVNYSFNNIDKDFIIAQLELGQAIVLFDGLDEVASESGRARIAKNIEQFSLYYPDTSIWVTSRLVGYTVNVKLDPKLFNHYYLAPVSQKQAIEFIEKWYNIQIPKNKTLRNDHINSLQKAIKENSGVQRLITNPLLLTMMTIVHQFEGSLPDNRAKLYEKCIEMLLKTWQEQKYSDLGIKNPLEERNLKYDDQLRLLAAAAYYIQNKNQDTPGDDTRGLIEEKELIQVFFDTRFDKRRMTEENAKEDIQVFLSYIRDRAGLLVEKGKNKKGENLFSFVHLSFLEYLCAYQIAEDRSKPQAEHIRQLLQYLGILAWEEPILLTLHIFSKSTGAPFIDVFTEAVLKKLSSEKNPNGWFLMGRAVRDNFNFAPRDIKKITSEIVDIWLESRDNAAFSILKEIVYFSEEGKKNLKEVIKENIKNNPANKAFNSLYLYKEFYGIDSSIPGIISVNTNYRNLLTYLPVYRNIEALKRYRDEMNVNQWVTYFNSASDKNLENLDNLLSNKVNSLELRGYLLSAWRHIFRRFQDHNRFLEQNKNGFDEYKQKFIFQYNFGNYTYIHFPLLVFMPYINFPINLTEPLNLTNQRFISEDQKHPFQPKDIIIKRWIDKIVEYILGEFEHSPSMKQPLFQNDKKYLMGMMSQFGESFIQDFLRNNNHHNLIRDFFQDLLRGSSHDFLQRFTHLLKQYLTGTGKSIQDVLWDFNREFTKNLKLGNLQKFGRVFTQYIDIDFFKDFIGTFLRDRIHNLSTSFKDLISGLYRKNYKKELEWEDLSESDYQRLNNLYVDEFTKGNHKFIDAVFSHLYEFVFYDGFQISIEPVVDSSDPKSPSLMKSTGIAPTYILISNSFMISFTFGFQLAAALNHFLIQIFSNWLIKFYNKDKLETQMITDAVDDYCSKNPFIFYIINFCWDFYAKDFDETCREQENNEFNHLRLGAFIVNAAKVSLTTGMPCKGEYWEKILETAEGISQSSLMVNISLTLYKLCNFQEREKNSVLLKNLLEKLKQEYPEDYQLLGSPYILGHI